MMNQLGWRAFDVASYAVNGSHSKAHHAGMMARAAVLAGPMFEGPAESDSMFSVRSTMRMTGKAA